MVLAGIRELAKWLGCRDDQAQDVVKSEPSAKLAMSRRGLFRAAGAVAAGSLFSFGSEPADAYEVRLVSYPVLVTRSPALVSFSAMLKERYTAESIDRLVYGDSLAIWLPPESS